MAVFHGQLTQIFTDPEQGLAAGGPVDNPVKLQVQLGHLLQLAALDMRFGLVDIVPEHLEFFRRDILGSPFDHQTFNVKPGGKDVLDILVGQVFDNVAGPGQRRDQTLLGEPLQGFPNRCSGYFQLLGYAGFIDMGAARDFSGQDILAQLLVNNIFEWFCIHLFLFENHLEINLYTTCIVNFIWFVNSFLASALGGFIKSKLICSKEHGIFPG